MLELWQIVSIIFGFVCASALATWTVAVYVTKKGQQYITKKDLGKCFANCRKEFGMVEDHQRRLQNGDHDIKYLKEDMKEIKLELAKISSSMNDTKTVLTLICAFMKDKWQLEIPDRLLK